MKDFLSKYLVRARSRSDQEGQDLVEYALLVGLITITGASISVDISKQIQIIFNRIAELLEMA